MKDKKLQELEVSFASLLNDMKKVKADEMSEMGEKEDSCESRANELFDYAMRICANLSDRITYLGDAFYQYTYQHNKGHIPPIKSASTMEKALKALGMGEDYEVSKPWVSVAKDSRGIVSAVAAFHKNETKA